MNQAPDSNPQRNARWIARRLVHTILLTLGLIGFLRLSPQARSAESTPPARIGTIEVAIGTVEVQRAGAAIWEPPGDRSVYPGDQVRAREHARVTLRMVDGSVIHLNELTRCTLGRSESNLWIDLARGILSFFHRDDPLSIDVRSRWVSGIIRGTEFVFGVDDEGKVELDLIDGEVLLTNAVGTLPVSTGEHARVLPGAAPERTPALRSTTAEHLQWVLHYPAVLVPEDLGLAADLATPLAAVLDRYASGDLLGALAAYPAGRRPADDTERALVASLNLAVGNVEEALRWLEAIPPASPPGRVAAALRRQIHAVRFQSCTDEAGGPASTLGTEWMAISYCQQAGRDLRAALNSARHATALAPRSGFAWARVAELEFSFGRFGPAAEALDRALKLAPRNAQALCLRGFLLAARRAPAAAIPVFDQAIAVDPKLANAWLGRGLARWKLGRRDEALSDLTMAAALEPQRGLLRSYLGKAYADSNSPDRAAHELELARRWDPGDPTDWLYSAFLNQQQNRINEALRDFTEAEARNDHRALFRSRLLLDQDRASLTQNRAKAFADAGFDDVAIREAGRALALDPANAAAHLFLAASYANGERVNLRYEAPRVAEYVQANLLAPVGGGLLSAALGPHEYTRLFEADGSHLFSSTAYRSSGAWNQNGGAFGTHGSIAYLADGFYSAGSRVDPNTDFETRGAELQIRAAAGDQDSFYLQALAARSDSGDLRTVQNPAARDPDLRFREDLEPVLVAGWHHTWNPEHHTLALASWIDATQDLVDPGYSNVAIALQAAATPNSGQPAVFYPTGSTTLRQETRMTWLGWELQHLWHTPAQTMIVGARYHAGEIRSRAEFPGFADTGVADLATAASDPDRLQAYAYETLRLGGNLSVTAGLSWDRLEAPANFRSAPMQDGDSELTRVSPKAGFVWAPGGDTWLRGAYARSLGGVAFEQGFRLEPTQVAGFNQSFRSLLPESVYGSLTGERMETASLALEKRAWTNTFLGLAAEWLASRADSRQGAFVFDDLAAAGPPPWVFPYTLEHPLRFRERALSLYASQLIGRDWAVSVRYRPAQTSVDETWPGIPADAEFVGTSPILGGSTRIRRHEIAVSTRFNHPGGWFAGADATWTDERSTALRGNATIDGWRLDLHVGLRFLQRRGEVLVGVENVTDQLHRWNPIASLSTPVEERTFVARLRWVY